MLIDPRRKPQGSSRAVIVLAICLLIVTTNVVVEHRKKLTASSSDSSETMQQQITADVTANLESDLQLLQSETKSLLNSNQAEIESLKLQVQTMNQEEQETKSLLRKSQTDLEALKVELESMKQVNTNDNNNNNKMVADTIKHPQPFTTAADSSLVSSLIWDTVEIHGVKFDFCVREQAHLSNLHSHVQREINGYAILKDAIQQSKDVPLVMDVGANHGLYSLFAAKLGADVITVEPQQVLCQAILEAAKRNGIEDKITVYHNAVLEQHEVITMKNVNINDGEMGTVVRNGGTGGDNVQVDAFPISQFVDNARRVAFLKIDVEGFDLHALQSANALFQQKRADNALVEFGPPSRWKSTAGDDVALGLTTLNDLHSQFGLDPRIIQGFEYNVWPSFIKEMKTTNEEEAAKTEKAKMYSFATNKNLLMDSMERSSEESFLWLVPESGDAKYPVFESECSGNRGGKQVTDSNGGSVKIFGCDETSTG